MSLSAFQWRQLSAPPSFAAATPAVSASSATKVILAPACAVLLPMERHPLGHWLGLVQSRVDRHEQEEQEIDETEEASRPHIHALGGLQAEITESDEAHRERGEPAF